MQIQWQLPKLLAGPGKSQPETLTLRAGDQLTASVLEVEKGKDALLAFGRFQAYARMPTPVVSGQQVQLRMETTDQGGLRMVLVPPGAKGGGQPSGQPLEIRMFEPVSEKPFLSSHAAQLKPGMALEGRITGFEKAGMKLVDFGAFKAFAKIDFPVREGQSVPLTVVQSGKELALSLDPRSAPTAQAAGNTAPAAPQGQSIAGGGNIQTAENPLAAAGKEPSPAAAQRGDAPPAAPATSAEVAVLREQIQNLLQSEGRPFNVAAMLDRNASPMQKALASLQQILNPAAPDGEMQTLVARVRAFVENSGIYFEKRLEEAVRQVQARDPNMPMAELARQAPIRDLLVKDMKPNLMILRDFLDAQQLDRMGAERHLLETLRSVVHRTVSHIEQQQQGATEKPMDPNVLQAFSHLLHLTEDPRNAQLKVYYGKKNHDGESKPPRVSLLLDMDPMGAVRTDLWMVGKNLNVTFFVPDNNVRTAIAGEQEQIGESLKHVFETVAVNVVVNQKKIADFQAEDQQAMPSTHQLDVSV